MTTKNVSTHPSLLSLLLLMATIGAAYVYGCVPAEAQSKEAITSAGATQPGTADVKGTWSGTFFPKHSNVTPFTMTVVIAPDSKGNLTGTSTLSSDCLKDVQLEVTVTGSKVVLAGSDESGDNITVWGTVDKPGTLLRASYILNGSATGRCESETGTSTLMKR